MTSASFSSFLLIFLCFTSVKILNTREKNNPITLDANAINIPSINASIELALLPVETEKFDSETNIPTKVPNMPNETNREGTLTDRSI